MQRPNCRTGALGPKMTRQGVEVDACGECGGVWLDKGELLHFAGGKRTVSRKLDE
ncbi:MAG TPA: hypothetical protein ENI79_01550 [Rhodospirillales bacterium]|nr:hypothetical protein [Rhodospirillales bacterium]